MNGLLIRFVVICLFSVGIGGALVWLGAGHVREGRFPITNRIHVNGLAARVGGIVFILIGAAVLLNGVVITLLTVWRIFDEP